MSPVVTCSLVLLLVVGGSQAVTWHWGQFQHILQQLGHPQEQTPERPELVTEWSYRGSNGPAFWVDLGFSGCAGLRQSPIDLPSCSKSSLGKPALQQRLPPLQLRGFGRPPLHVTATNDLVTALFQPRWGLLGVPRVSGADLPGTFEVVNFHFHWGVNDTVGSEHTVDGKHRPLEMHIVCRNIRFATMEEALQEKDGIAVLSVMFEQRNLFLDIKSKNSDIIFGQSLHIDSLLSALRPLRPALQALAAPGAQAEVHQPPSLQQLMPQDTTQFWRYQGSLTTPGCFQVASWLIFQKTAFIGEEDLTLLRRLEGSEGKPIGNAFRPTQELNGRAVKNNGFC